jgi:hypothetical protein
MSIIVNSTWIYNKIYHIKNDKPDCTQLVEYCHYGAGKRGRKLEADEKL